MKLIKVRALITYTTWQKINFMIHYTHLLRNRKKIVIKERQRVLFVILAVTQKGLDCKVNLNSNFKSHFCINYEPYKGVPRHLQKNN